MDNAAVKLERAYDWLDYEAAKAEWLRLNPEATPEQIQRACRDIAEGMGL